MEGTGRGGADRRDPCQGGGTQLAVTLGMENQVAEEEDVSGRAWGPWSSEGERLSDCHVGCTGSHVAGHLASRSPPSAFLFSPCCLFTLPLTCRCR
jgi:hypothetical protein